MRVCGIGARRRPGIWRPVFSDRLD
jgi:hypothetical protein